MILSVQRVKAPGGAHGINCYHYVHGEVSVDNPAEFHFRKATLVWQDRPLPQTGNRVRSWVDVAAPDDTGWADVFGALDVLLELPVMPQAFSPADSVVAFALNMDSALRPEWRREVLFLLEHLLRAHP